MSCAQTIPPWRRASTTIASPARVIANALATGSSRGTRGSKDNRVKRRRAWTQSSPIAVSTPASPTYRAAAEIIRGIREVSGLAAVPGEPGWLAVRCESPAMARWLSEAIVAELVAARCDGPTLFVPVGAAYTITGEIKNVVTVVAKTTHYWHEHLPTEVKQTLAAQARLAALTTRVRGWLRRSA